MNHGGFYPICLQKAVIPSARELDLYSYDYDDIRLSDDGTCQATLRMFLEIGVITKFHVPYEVCPVREIGVDE